MDVPFRTEVLGVVGGLGHAATARLYMSVARQLAATGSRSHPRIVIESVPLEREVESAFIRGTVTARERQIMREHLARAVERLVASGVTCVAVACNTLQGDVAALTARANVPFIDMLGATARTVAERGCRSALLLATGSTYRSGSYERAMADWGLAIVVPEPSECAMIAECIMRLVGDVESAVVPVAVRRAMSELVDRYVPPADAVILGCTDLSPLAGRLRGVVVDSLDALAGFCVQRLCPVSAKVSP
jgi:aspartate racemase